MSETITSSLVLHIIRLPIEVSSNLHSQVGLDFMKIIVVTPIS